MAEGAPNTLFSSIADAATASWYAHRASTPNSKQSPSIRHSSTQAREVASMPPLTSTTPVASASPMPSSVYPGAAQVTETTKGAASGASLATSPEVSPTSSDRDSDDAQVSGDVSIRSDITAWQSALQALPPDFADSELPLHPLAQALCGQPTLRGVEWNQYRQQGGFVPRTPHDFSSLMIYLSGQINPNPCRNCLLRNGPFARCVVSPPAVLAISTIRHACANCTYQNQYKKCTNEPISEQEKIRSELARPVTMAKPRSTIPRKPKTNTRLQERREERLRPVQSAKERRRQKRLQEQLQKEQRLEKRGGKSITQAMGGLGMDLSNDFKSFDEKLRLIRASSPRSRRRMAAETLQWQAAIATVEAEGLAPTPGMSTHTSVPEVISNNHFQTPLNNYTASQHVQTTPTTFEHPARNYSIRAETTSYDIENTAEPMDEDESDDEDDHGDEYRGARWVGPNHTGPMIKAPR